jgi:hypothetical protein
MANVKTYDLLQCSRLYPTVEGANNPAFLPFSGQVVKVNNDDQQSYTVKENIQARFFAPTSADLVSNVQYSVTSILFNGLECLLAPANLLVEESDNIHIEFPLYAGDPNGYTSNLANAVYNTTLPATAGYFERNFPDFMQSLFDSLDISAQITNSHPDWWSLDAFEIMRNFMVEMYNSDSLSIAITETYNGVSRELMYEVDGTGAKAYIGGVDVTLLPVPLDEQPQFGDEYSIYSVPFTANPIEEIDCCPLVNPFYASLQSDCESTLNVDCDCSKITFSDTSNYNNGLIGHDPSFFNHRTIILTRPDGTQYVWSTDGVVGQPACPPLENVSQVVNEIIAPHYNSSNMFSYSLLNGDQDGIYTVEICTYPDWQDGLFYDIALNNFVYRNGVIYKQIASSTSIDPELDLDNNFWIAASLDDERGRYCSEEKIVLLCRKIMDCYKGLVEEALCGIKSNPCKSMCDNKELMNAMKMRVTMDALEWAVCDESWELAEEHISILKSICCCNG